MVSEPLATPTGCYLTPPIEVSATRGGEEYSRWQFVIAERPHDEAVHFSLPDTRWACAAHRTRHHEHRRRRRRQPEHGRCRTGPPLGAERRTRRVRACGQ